MRAVGGGNSKVIFKAASKANVTIPRETKEVGADGALSHYNVTDVHSYMKVNLFYRCPFVEIWSFHFYVT